jgi:hypothetical protein
LLVLRFWGTLKELGEREEYTDDSSKNQGVGMGWFEGSRMDGGVGEGQMKKGGAL